jgi:hypothetical protein
MGSLCLLITLLLSVLLLLLLPPPPSSLLLHPWLPDRCGRTCRSTSFGRRGKPPGGTKPPRPWLPNLRLAVQVLGRAATSKFRFNEAGFLFSNCIRNLPTVNFEQYSWEEELVLFRTAIAQRFPNTAGPPQSSRRPRTQFCEEHSSNRWVPLVPPTSGLHQGRARIPISDCGWGLSGIGLRNTRSNGTSKQAT